MLLLQCCCCCPADARVLLVESAHTLVTVHHLQCRIQWLTIGRDSTDNDILWSCCQPGRVNNPEACCHLPRIYVFRHCYQDDGFRRCRVLGRTSNKWLNRSPSFVSAKLINIIITVICDWLIDWLTDWLTLLTRINIHVSQNTRSRASMFLMLVVDLLDRRRAFSLLSQSSYLVLWEPRRLARTYAIMMTSLSLTSYRVVLAGWGSHSGASPPPCFHWPHKIVKNTLLTPSGFTANRVLDIS